MLKKIAKGLLAPINPSGIVLLAAYTIVWGVWLANPWWSVFEAADLYGAMKDLAPEWAWGWLAIISGVAGLYGVMRPSYRNLLIGSAVGTWHWGTLSLMYFLGDWQNTGGITSVFIALYSAFVFTNVRTNKLGSNGHVVDSDY